MMQRFLLIMVMLLWSNASLAEEKICSYEEILNKISPCDSGHILKRTLESMFFDLMPRPKNVSVEQYRELINKRIHEWDAGADQRNKEYEADRKNEIDLKCEILAGRANNSSSAKKIYKKCMKAEGY